MTPSDDIPMSRRWLLRRRRKTLSSGVLLGLLCGAAVAGLVALAFSQDRHGWNDEARVVQTHGLVVDEMRASGGSCKGADFETQLEWTQDGDLRTVWTATCRSGPDVGDTVDLWVRDDGAVKLTSPSATNGLMILGGLFFVGMGAVVFFSTRAMLHTVNTQLAAPAE